MSKNYKTIIKLILLVIAVLSFTACKIIEDNKELFNIKDWPSDELFDPKPYLEPLPDEGNVRMPPDVHESSLTQLRYIKINDENIDINFTSSASRSNTGKNSNVAKTEGSDIRSIEIGFEPENNEGNFKNYVSVNLRSLDGEKSLNVNYDSYLIGHSNEFTDVQEEVSIFYDDYMAGYYASSYGAPLQLTERFFNYNAEKLSINVVELLQFLQENQFDHFDPYMPRLPDNGNYDISSKFFSDELFSLQISMGGEIIYDGQIFRALKNCIFASSEPSPADVGDICKAYMAMY